MNAHAPSEATDEAGDDPIYEAAALWVARLASADATDADREACAIWQAADLAHAEAYAEMDAWRRTMGQVPDPRRHKAKTKSALGIVAVIGLTGVLSWQLGWVDRLRANDWTAVGEIRHTTLEDGSRVDLNTDSALALHFTPEERSVELMRGEAVFDVVPDPRRPFVVRRNGVRARAVGTRFYVRADGAADPVGVAEGHVDVATAAGHVLLQAGEVASLDAMGRPVAQASNVAQAIAWRDGRLVFSGQPLSSVLAELDRYRHGRILLTNAALGERRFSGTLDPRDTEAALRILASAMKIRITQLTPFLVLVR